MRRPGRASRYHCPSPPVMWARHHDGLNPPTSLPAHHEAAMLPTRRACRACRQVRCTRRADGGGGAVLFVAWAPHPGGHPRARQGGAGQAPRRQLRHRRSHWCVWEHAPPPHATPHLLGQVRAGGSCMDKSAHLNHDGSDAPRMVLLGRCCRAVQVWTR